MLSGSRNIVFHGGTFTEAHTHHHEGTEGLKKLQERIAPGAFHNSGERFDPPKCHPQTRLAIRKIIMEWVENACVTFFIMWLYGPAGAGKSAIAQSIAEECYALGTLAGSFFFSRTAPGRNDTSRLIPTLVYQLIMAVPEMRPHVDIALQHDPMVFDRSLEAQMETLIVKPLAEAFPEGYNYTTDLKARLIILDGLDECRGHDAQRYILNVIHGAFKRLSMQFRFLIASRPEQHIRDSFNMRELSASTTALPLDDTYEPDSDIRIFLESKFNDIKATHPYKFKISNDWPSASAIEKLIEKSSGQFIYASTVIKYVESPRHWPTKRLDIVLGLKHPGRDTPFAALDNLYTLIFDLVEQPDDVLKVFSLIILEQSLTVKMTVEFVEKLFSYDPGDLYDILIDLHSVLYIPSPDHANHVLRVFHASLGDFLMDRSRSGKYFIDKGEAYALLTEALLRQIPTQWTHINQLDPCQRFSCQVLCDYCLSALPTKSLLESLFAYSLYHIFSFYLQEGTIQKTVPMLFNWFEEQNALLKSYFPDNKTQHDLHRHHLSSWDKFMLQSIARSPDQSLTRQFLTASACDVFTQYPTTIRDLILDSSPAFRTSPSSNFFWSGLGLNTSISANHAALGDYCPMILAFLTNVHRSGQYHVTEDDYHNLAQVLIRYLSSHEYLQADYTHDLPFVWKVKCCASYLPLILSKSVHSLEFVTDLRLVSRQIERAKTAGNKSVEILKAIEAYSSKVNDPKNLRCAEPA
ncbi:hypothetical protein B0H34DRAFT_709978 [Crassisporium funariophilum]|nr:hypothetical protein B0H34DRAFT_709978 [Crassisporium funariophilum]